jgi:hypothetical protein
MMWCRFQSETTSAKFQSKTLSLYTNYLSSIEATEKWPDDVCWNKGAWKRASAHVDLQTHSDRSLHVYSLECARHRDLMFNYTRSRHLSLRPTKLNCVYSRWHHHLSHTPAALTAINERCNSDGMVFCASAKYAAVLWIEKLVLILIGYVE